MEAFKKEIFSSIFFILIFMINIVSLKNNYNFTIFLTKKWASNQYLICEFDNEFNN